MGLVFWLLSILSISLFCGEEKCAVKNKGFLLQDFFNKLGFFISLIKCIFFAIHTVFVFDFAHISVVIRRSPDVCLQIMLTAFASGYMMMRHRFPIWKRRWF